MCLHQINVLLVENREQIPSTCLNCQPYLNFKILILIYTHCTTEKVDGEE